MSKEAKLTTVQKKRASHGFELSYQMQSKEFKITQPILHKKISELYRELVVS